jgi:hypothetical protein
VLTLNQIYGWSDIKLTVSTLYTDCGTKDVCKMGLTFGIRAPKLLKSAIEIPIPNAVKAMFPICASVGAPAIGKVTAEKDIPVTLTLGTSVILPKDGSAPVRKASATIFADKNVFAENTEVTISPTARDDRQCTCTFAPVDLFTHVNINIGRQ